MNPVLRTSGRTHSGTEETACNPMTIGYHCPQRVVESPSYPNHQYSRDQKSPFKQPKLWEGGTEGAFIFAGYVRSFYMISIKVALHFVSLGRSGVEETSYLHLLLPRGTFTHTTQQKRARLLACPENFATRLRLSPKPPYRSI